MGNHNKDLFLIEPEELSEPDNPALKKIADFMPILAIIDKKVFYRNVGKVVDIACPHFGINSKE